MRQTWIFAATVGALTVSACSGGPQLPSVTTAALPKFSLGENGVVAASATEVYSRIALGANRCWFGSGGRFRRSHILHADAESPQKGGAVEIVLHERATDQPKPWGYKAYRIAVAESSGQSTVEVENLRMAEPEDMRMRTEVMRWAAGRDECEVPPEVPAPSAAADQKPEAKAASRKR